MDKLISAIGWEYLRTKALVLEDGGQELVQRQKGFQYVNPTEDWFPGTSMKQDANRCVRCYYCRLHANT